MAPSLRAMMCEEGFGRLGLPAREERTHEDCCQGSPVCVAHEKCKREMEDEEMPEVGYIKKHVFPIRWSDAWNVLEKVMRTWIQNST